MRAVENFYLSQSAIGIIFLFLKWSANDQERRINLLSLFFLFSEAEGEFLAAAAGILINVLLAFLSQQFA